MNYFFRKREEKISRQQAVKKASKELQKHYLIAKNIKQLKTIPEFTWLEQIKIMKCFTTRW